MKLEFTPYALKNLASLKKEDNRLLVKLWDFLIDIHQNHPKGIGHTEALKHDWEGWWSKELSPKHRVVYQIVDEVIVIAMCYGHYYDK